MSVEATEDRLVEEWKDWRRAHHERLADPHGFLAITGLHWLDEEPRRFPDAPGAWSTGPGGVVVTLDEGDELVVDGTPVRGEHGFGVLPERGGVTAFWKDAAIEVAKRGGHDIIRPRHPDNPLRAAFQGTPDYDHDPRWIVTGRYVPFDEPRPTTVGAAVEGLEHVYDAPGRVEFELGGDTVSLIARLLANLRGDYLGDEDTRIQSPGNVQRPRLQPHSPGLLDRVWYGGTSLRSVRWAGEHRLNLLSGNIVLGETGDDFVSAQVGLIEEYRRLHPSGRVAIGRVVVPLDGADAATRERYRAYAASRHERTLKPHGERRILFAPDLVGTSAEIVERLRADRAVAAVSELRLEPPYEFGLDDYEHERRAGM
ncbi:DUF1684 domain-containing protein [Spirillospora sp. NPDC047279]|uniref:DUF1684 domain-containing protein n=1 Tax=Spirillospora sp. NPDC047279 TaxID=3155478 RepID=UPI0034070453